MVLRRKMLGGTAAAGVVPAAREYLWWQVAEYGFDSFMIRSRAKAT
jgi:hypothetical protein